MRRRWAAIVKGAWSDASECLIGTLLFSAVAFGLCGLLGGGIVGAVSGWPGAPVLGWRLGRVLLGLLTGALLGGAGGTVLGALFGGAFGVFSGILVGSVELGLGVKEVIAGSLRAQRSTGALTEVTPALTPAGRGDEATAATIGRGDEISSAGGDIAGPGGRASER